MVKNRREQIKKILGDSVKHFVIVTEPHYVGDTHYPKTWNGDTRIVEVEKEWKDQMQHLAESVKRMVEEYLEEDAN